VWWRFSPWNARLGIVRATFASVVADRFGRAAAEALEKYGLDGEVAIPYVMVGARRSGGSKIPTPDPRHESRRR
jgi:hypothetical protein